MKLKLENGQVVLQDGHPVYIKDDGSEIAVDVARTFATVSRLNNENKTVRERAETLEKTLGAYGGVSPEDVKANATKLQNITDKKMLDSEGVEKLKSEINKGWEAKLAEEQKARNDLQSRYDGSVLKTAFLGSKLVGEKLRIPADMVQSHFGGNFKVIDGKIVGQINGNNIMSSANPGELADFDEALGAIVNAYPNKADILKPDQKSGSGAPSKDTGNPRPNEGNMGGNRAERTAAIAARFGEALKTAS